MAPMETSASAKKILVVASKPLATTPSFIVNQIEALVEAGHAVPYCALQRQVDPLSDGDDVPERLRNSIASIQLVGRRETLSERVRLFSRGVGTLLKAAAKSAGWRELFIGLGLNPRLVRIAASRDLHG